MKKKYLTGVLTFLVIAIFSTLAFGSSTDESSDDSDEDTKEESSNNEVNEEDSNIEKTWVSVAKLNTSTDKKGDTFKLEGGKQKLVYKVTGTNDMIIGAVYVMKEGKDKNVDGGIPEVMIDKAGTDESILRKGKGEYYLDISIANGDIEVELFEER